MRQTYIAIVFGLALITFTTAASHGRGYDKVANAPTFAGSLTLVNNSWNRVTVEVRKGKFDDVNQNSVFDTKTIGKGKWTIPCSSDEGYVWWRRDADPDHPNGQWNGWTRKACFGKDEETSL